MARADAWTHEEMILVLNLYLKLPFGKMDRRNPDVIHLANIIGRTPNAVALRLVNYASCDPQAYLHRQPLDLRQQEGS